MPVNKKDKAKNPNPKRYKKAIICSTESCKSNFEVGAEKKGMPLHGPHRNYHFVHKLDTPELRRIAFDAYCDWVASGKSQSSFSFEHEGIKAHYRTIINYMREYPDELPKAEFENAINRGQAVWEDRGIRLMEGEFKHAQASLFPVFMRQLYKWNTDTTIGLTNMESDVRRMLTMLEGSSSSAKDE